MAYQVEIKEGHDSSSYFWFIPVIVKRVDKINDDHVTELEDEFSIEQTDVDRLLSYFLYQYFDADLFYNRHRYEYPWGYIRHFEQYLTYNFYTYDTLQEMLKEMEHIVELIENDYSSEELAPLKKYWRAFVLCDYENPDWNDDSDEAVERHKDVLIDFYKRFIARMRKMMKHNPQANLISVMGP